jgi:hypothetical protein
MDEFVHLQQVLERHHIPFPARERRPALGPLVMIGHGSVSILLSFDQTVLPLLMVDNSAVLSDQLD